MRSKKTLAKTLVFAMAVSLMPMSAHVAKADAIEADHVKFNGDIGVITAPKTESKAKYWGFAKELKNEKGANFVKNGSGNSKIFYKISDIQEIKDEQIDISEFFGKKVIIAVGSVATLAALGENPTPDANWTLKEIKVADKTFNVGYIAKVGDKFGKLSTTEAGNTINGDAFGALAAYKIENKEVKGLDPNAKEGEYEVKQGEGDWRAIKKGNQAPANQTYFFESFNKDHTAPKFKMLVQSGSTLYFRLKATEDTWPGDAKKVTFKKQPKAPKVTLDVVKETSNIKSGMKVMLKKDNSSGDQAENKDITEGTKKADFKMLGIDGIEGGKTGLMTVSTEAGKGKIASKELSLYITRPADITLKEGAGAMQGNEKDEAQGQKATLIENKLDLRLKVGYDISKGAELVNSGDVDYEYYVEHADKANGEGTPKWKKLKMPKNKKKPTVATLKYSSTSKPYTFGDNGSKLHIRVAGKKQTGNKATLASKAKTIQLKLANIEQTMTAEVAGEVSGSLSSNEGTLTLANVPKNKDKTYKFALVMTNRDKVKKPSIKLVSKLPGVSVKVGNFSKDHKSPVEIKIGKKAFKDASGTPELQFNYTAEGLKNKTIKVQFTLAN